MILIDASGYGQWGTFGGQIPTPILDRLAKAGLSFTRFHTTALCSPTRAALLTGRNHHSVGMGVITELADAYPGLSLTKTPCALLRMSFCQANLEAQGAESVRLHLCAGLAYQEKLLRFIENHDEPRAAVQLAAFLREWLQACRLAPLGPSQAQSNLRHLGER